MTKVKLYYRNIRGDGHVMMTVDIETVLTVGDLKGSVVEQLKDSWSQQDPPFQLKKKHIRIHRVVGGELKAIKDNATQCNDEWVYLALEVFVNEMPLMLRTVGFDQLNPVVLTHPDVNQDYTKCAPIYCAAMSADESKPPALSLQTLDNPIPQKIRQEDAEEKKLDDEECDVKTANENLVHIVAFVKANGASLFCKDECMPIATPVDPCGPIQATEQVGKTKMSLEQYQTLLGQKGKRHPLLKYLRTNRSHGKDWNRPLDSSLEPSPTAERFVICTRKEKNGAKQKGEPITVNKRASYFRFKVSSVGLDGLGVEVVYDNIEHHHCTLVTTKEQEESDKWKINGVDKVITPVGFLKRGENIMDKEDLDSMLRSFYSPAEETEPQFFAGTVGNKHGSFYLFPKAAAQFQLHDIKMEASAEPKAPEGDFDESVKTLYEAALILFYASDDEGVQEAIVQLADAGYKVDALSFSWCQSLLTEMDRVYHAYGDSEIAAMMGDTEVEDEEGVEEYSETLLDAIEIVKKRSTSGKIEGVIVNVLSSFTTVTTCTSPMATRGENPNNNSPQNSAQTNSTETSHSTMAGEPPSAFGDMNLLGKSSSTTTESDDAVDSVMGNNFSGASESAC